MERHSGPRPTRAPSHPVRVGVIGIGVMGRPMARHLMTRLPEGSEVVVTALQRGAAAELEAIGVRWADTARELAGLVDTVVYVVPDMPQVRASLTGPGGLLAGVGERRLDVVISSTTSPTAVRALASELTEATDGRVRVVDAPISGGQEGAEAGTLSIMVGGPTDAVDRVLPVLAAAGTPVHLGDVGAGQVAKACNQIIVAAAVVAMAEAATLAERAGLDVLAMFDLLGGGYAGSRIMEVKKHRFAEHDYSPSGPARFMIKDLGAALEEAASTGSPVPVTTQLLSIFEGVTAAGLGDLDTSVVQQYLAGAGAASPAAGPDPKETP